MINKIKIVIGIETFQYISDCDDLEEKSNNLDKDNPDIVFKSLVMGILRFPNWDVSIDLSWKISW